MTLPETFIFTQQNLQDYIDCNRRFYLREILKLEWPAIESEPVREQEELILLGTQFHLLCQQFFLGIPVEDLSDQITNLELQVWWQNFLKLDFKSLNGTLSSEKLISIPFAGFRLAAKYDLLLRDLNGKNFIYDWKTSKNQPQRKYLVERMQSKIYPLVISKYNGAKRSDTDFNPESIDMIYWYPAFPNTPISFGYSKVQFEADQTGLEKLIYEINKKKEPDFVLTEREKTCSYCRYRSLCNRGVTAGVSDQQEIDFQATNAFNFDFEAL